MVIFRQDLEGVSATRFPAPALEGLTGPVGDLQVLNLSLAEHQERALLGNGVRFSEASPTRGWVACRADAYFTAKTVQALLEEASGEDLVVRIGGRSGGFADEIALSTPEEPLLAWLSGGGEVTPERLAAAQTITLDPQEQFLELPVPADQFGVSLIELPLTERLLLPCAHWLQLLWTNILGMVPFLWRTLSGKNAAEAVVRLGWAALRAGSVRPERVVSRLKRVSRSARIHPSAVVEASWLGDNVEIGANAVVRGCVIGDGARVEELSVVEYSVLGPGACVQRQGMLKFSLASSNASIGGVMQLGVLCPGAAVKRGALMMDMSFGQQVRVQHRGGLTAAPLGIAGVCVGQGALIGAGVQVAGGRAIPASVQIVADANVLVRIPDTLPGVRLVIRNGTLEAL